jgi:hypothetical protein
VLPWLLILCSVACAKADIIIGNVSSSTDNGSNGFSSIMSWAGAFTMGNNAYTLTDVYIAVVGIFQPGATFDLDSDLLGLPAPSQPNDVDVVLTIQNPPPIYIAGVTATYTFAPGTPFILEADTTYWLTATSTNATPTHWANNVPTIPVSQLPAGVGATYGGREEASAILNNFGWDGTAENNSDIFEVDGTLLSNVASTPEPESGGLAIIGLALFLPLFGRKTLAGRFSRGR